MNVLAINCGSTSLKFALVHAAGPNAGAEQRQLASGTVRGIGPDAQLSFEAQAGARLDESRNLPNQGAAAAAALDCIREAGLGGEGMIDAVGHRVVHGGSEFEGPTRVDANTIEAIEALEALAPLHNGPALAAMRAAAELLGPSIPVVATFDTAFHRTMPPRAFQYALPLELMNKHGIRRFGFHGLAHRWMVERFGTLTARPPDGTRLVTLQLGGGCSAAAIDAGRSVDTTMGFTPLEGLMMNTRSGDIDPSLPGFLAEHEHTDATTIDHLLNSRSGLLGVSGRSEDVRELLKAEAGGDARAALALEMFCYRIRKAIGAYLAALGGADAIIFGGGIGEWQPPIRGRICADMEWCGVHLDAERNSAALGSEARISANRSAVEIYVIPVDEEAIIVRDTVACLHVATQH